MRAVQITFITIPQKENTDLNNLRENPLQTALTTQLRESGVLREVFLGFGMQVRIVGCIILNRYAKYI
jgi:hypothetical protein